MRRGEIMSFQEAASLEGRIQDFRDLLATARMVMAKNAPIFYWLLKSCKVYYTDEIKGSGICETNGNVITFNRSMWTQRKVFYVALIHELMHIALRHVFRVNEWYKLYAPLAPEEQVYEFIELVADAKVAQYMMQLSLRDDYAAYDRISSMTELREFDKMSVEEALSKLFPSLKELVSRLRSSPSPTKGDLKVAMKGGGQGQRDEQDSNDGGGHGQREEKSNDSGAGGGKKEQDKQGQTEGGGRTGNGSTKKVLIQDEDASITEAKKEGKDLEEIVKQQIANAVVRQKMAGIEAGELTRVLMEEWLTGKPLPWHIILKRWLGEQMAKSMISDYRKESRKHPMLPGLRRSGLPSVHVFVDLSGSIGDDEFAMFAMHISGLLRETEVTAYYWSDELAEVRKVRTKKDLLKPVKNVGGGTCFAPVLEKVKLRPSDIMIVITDGYWADTSEAQYLLKEKFKKNPKVLITSGVEIDGFDVKFHVGKR
jgi:predicted metal-dependent peptidase